MITKPFSNQGERNYSSLFEKDVLQYPFIRDIVNDSIMYPIIQTVIVKAC